jgi:hypothetical protein
MYGPSLVSVFPFLHTHARCVLWKPERETGGDARRVVDLSVLSDERLPFILREIRECTPERALIDEQHVLHRFLLPLLCHIGSISSVISMTERHEGM